MTRLLFRKEGKAKFISHLDLMRTMQRVFIRAGVTIKHTEGFNPHPYMNFALPLSVGTESVCELMDFELTGDTALSDIPDMLNRGMPEGITVIKAYESTRKFKEIAFLRIHGELIYDNGSGEMQLFKLRELFSRDDITVEKKTKRGTAESNLSSGLSDMELTASEDRVFADFTLSVQPVAFSPALLIEAIRRYLPESVPDMALFKRLEVLCGNKNVFR